MYPLKKAVLIYSNKELFEEIHEAKKAFIDMLENISKRIDLDDLKKIHPRHKGIKISKGNELEHCPYQVLDLIRDFDPESGLNIRLLHWWGKGMFLFILVGKEYFRREMVGMILANEQFADFMISTSLSPFAYKLIVEDFEINKIPQTDSLSDYSDLGRFQLMKQIPYGDDFSGTEGIIMSELKHIIFTLQKIERE